MLLHAKSQSAFT